VFIFFGLGVVFSFFFVVLWGGLFLLFFSVFFFSLLFFFFFFWVLVVFVFVVLFFFFFLVFFFCFFFFLVFSFFVRPKCSPRTLHIYPSERTPHPLPPSELGSLPLPFPYRRVNANCDVLPLRKILPCASSSDSSENGVPLPFASELPLIESMLEFSNFFRDVLPAPPLLFFCHCS